MMAMMEKKWKGEEIMVLMTLLILCIMAKCICATTDPSDASALRYFYSSLNSPAQLTKWSASGGDPCDESWKGVSCSGSRITQIKIPSLGLSGSLGFSLTSLLSLTELDVSNNNLAGSITYQLPYNVQRLNLANNQFSQSVPYSVSNLTSLVYLNLAHNQLQGSVTDVFQSLTSLSTLDFSFNQFSGNLPESFSYLSSMTSMYLQNNQLTGTIDVLAGLPLKTLNVANNQFSGWIPQQLKSGVDLQSGGNNWNSGSAPPPPPGTPPASKTPSHKSKSPGSDSGGDSKKSGIGGGGIAGIIIGIFVIGGIIAFFLVKRRSRRSSTDLEKLDNQPLAPFASNHEVLEFKAYPAPSTMEIKKIDTSASINIKPPPVDRHKSFDEEDFSIKPVVVKKIVKTPTNVTSYSIADLQMATGSFSADHLLGEGSFGRVYRAHLDNGKVLAVKKINSTTLPTESSDDFIEMVSKISELHHPNVTELVGYCSEHGQHLLVYEFHKNGSLHDFLHLSDEFSKPLIWNTRVKIALGTARAFEYLHEVCAPSIIHKNIKSANILLDTELNPHLSDSGLASFLPNADQILNQDAGSGYTAPEVSMSGQYTLKSDVYGFGVVMLELLTGRNPFDSSRPRSEQSLVRWATPQLHDIDALSKMVDPVLKGLYPVKSLSRFADVIALCVQPEPEFRPPMSEVVQALVRLVQRANMSKRTIGVEQGMSPRGENPDSNEYMS